MNYKNKVILGGFIGNVVEAYDMSICYFLSSELSRELLGDTQGKPTVILSLIFIAYLAKPMGAFLLGLLSDIYGRKNVLIGSILVMGLSTALIGAIPNYNKIGLLAPAFLLYCRIIQSMALGSEFLNSSSLLVESGDAQQRGFRGCWSSVGVKAGYLFACLVVETLRAYTQTHPQFEYWRIPFLLALITSFAGYYIRSKMPESLAYILYYADKKKPSTRILYKEALIYTKKHPFIVHFAFFTSLLSVTSGYFFYLYIPMHAIEYAELPRSFIMLSTMCSLLLVCGLIPLFGWLSDKKDRLVLLSSASIGLLLLSYPFMQAINYGNGTYFFCMQLLISIPCACYYSVATVLLTELVPLPIRCTSLSLIYALAASLASGVPPLLADYLVRRTQWLSAPSLIVIFLTLIVLFNVQLLVHKQNQGELLVIK
ncbi:MFS transporter [Legionella sp. km772]|uniref:MFS transporter n=1 Tax=Legionella sp. km772 TaxID=2498111 RepID=UPI000F8D0CDF|nr:MFS transporter [Legionella sp. km772]RUR12014.1 MFS transporter [Legionella sp. km772]